MATINSGDKRIHSATMRAIKKIELPLLLLALLAGAAFLLKMCYLSLAFNCLFGLVFLGIVYAYVRWRHEVTIPLVLLALVFVALQVDALGNYFRMYGRQFGPLQYDEFSHMMVQVLVTPVFVWLVRHLLERWGYQLPLKLTGFFAGTIIFSLSAFYEIIELWDEVYFGGHRIWSIHDTATDLQWDLCGIILGTLLAHFLLRTIAAEMRAPLQQSRA
ncbi:MAG TPA: hypothetical protein VKB46_13010 [Pyrinomonadaceae bacterium]|nr:hypothetical protein [Pyrinomonadaceae bacterium]